MATERQICEAVERCVATMVYHHNMGASGAESERMEAEVQALAGAAAGLDMDTAGAEAAIVGPLGAELLARYGPVAGALLLGKFAAAFGRWKPADGRSLTTEGRSRVGAGGGPTLIPAFQGPTSRR